MREKKWKQMTALLLAILMALGTVQPYLPTAATYASEIESGDEDESQESETQAETEPETQKQSAQTEDQTKQTDSAAQQTEQTDSSTGVKANALQALQGIQATNDATLDLNAVATTATLMTGQTGAIRITLTIPPLSTGEIYQSATVSIAIPDNVDMRTAEGSIVNNYDVVTIGTKKYLVINLNPALSPGESQTITVPFTTENFVFENDQVINFPTNFSVSYNDADNQIQQLSIEKTPTVTMKATDGWRVKKAVAGDVTKVDGSDGKQYYEVTYTIDAINQNSNTDPQDTSLTSIWNRNGRLNFETVNGEPAFELVDILPTNYPAGGAATIVSVSTKTRGTLAAGTDYTVTTDQGVATSITFKTLDTLTQAIADTLGSQYLAIGDPIDTQYTVVLRYPVEPYLTTEDIDAVIYDLQNEAILKYTFIGQTEQTKSSTAIVHLGENDGVKDATTFTVEKWVQIGDQLVKLDSAALAAGYDNATFALYTTAVGSTVVNNKDKNPIGTPADLGVDGTITYEDVLTGKSVYLDEIYAPAGFTGLSGRLKIDIDESGNISIANKPDNVTIEGSKIKIVNKTTQLGNLEFWKQGLGADGSIVNLSGITFTLVSESDPTKTYTAISDSNGRVYFQAIPAGNYKLKETDIPAALQPEYEAGNDRDITITANTINHPVWSDTGSTAAHPVYLNISNCGKLKLIKVDEEKNAANQTVYLSGAVFGVFKDIDCNQKVAELTSDEYGVAISDSIPIGNYYYKEIMAPQGYAMDPTVRPVTIIENTVIDVGEIINKQQLPLSLHKTGTIGDGIITEELFGIMFNIYDSETAITPICTLITYSDATGKAVTKIYNAGDTAGSEAVQPMLDPGDYWYEEIASSVPSGYTPIVGRVKVTLNKDNKQFEVKNSAFYGQIVIHKVDAADTNKGLEGAVFEIYDNANFTGTPVDTITTNAQGYAASKVLQASGTMYYIKEMTAPDGYAIIMEYIKGVDSSGNGTAAGNGIGLTAGLQTQVTVKNAQQVSIQLTKKDSVTDDVIKQAVSFTLYSDAACTQVVATAQTSAGTGICTFTNLNPGTQYWYKETSTPTGYQPNTSSVYSITTPSAGSANLIASADVTNIRLGKLLIHKTTKMDDPTGNTPMSGVVFKLYKVVNDDATDYASGITAYKTSTATNASGDTSINDIEPGTYWLVETAVSGYSQYISQVTIVAGQNQGTGYSSETKNIVNEPTQGKIQIKKISSVNSATNLVARFDVFKGTESGGVITYSSTRTTELVTASNGTITSGWLDPGYYRLVETSVTGDYVVNATPIDLIVVAGQTNTTSYDSPITNDPLGTLNIYKTSKMDNVEAAFAGAVFKLYKYVEGQAFNIATAELYQTATATGANGKTSFTKVAPGEYWLVEDTIENYAAMTPVKVTVLPGQNTTGAAVADTNVVNNPSMGKIKIEKVSSLDSSVKVNATFEFFKSDGQSGYESVAVATLTTGTSGVNTSGWLAPGTYKMVEKSVEGDYVLDQTERIVVITAGETNLLYTGMNAITNEPQGRISIDKKAKFAIADANGVAGSNPSFSRYDLKGSKFTIYKASSETSTYNQDLATLVFETEIDLTLSSSGTSSYLDPGFYWVVETQTPEGYTSAAPFKVEVLADQTVAASNTGDVDQPYVDNEPEAGRLRLQKYSLNNGSKLDGADFEVYRVIESGETAEVTLPDGTQLIRVNATASTNADGSIMQSGTHGTGEALTVDIKPGTYYLKEVSTESIFPYTVDWKWVTQWTGPYVVAAGNETLTGAIYNYYEVEGEGYKQTLAGADLPGAYIAAFASNLAAQNFKDTYLNAAFLADDSQKTAMRTNLTADTAEAVQFRADHGIVDVAVTGADGVFKFTHLVPGSTYYIMEVVPPDGYAFETVGQTDGPAIVGTTVDANGVFDKILDFVNVPMGRLQVIKFTTLTGNPFTVDGVTFMVYQAKPTAGNASSAYEKDGTYYEKVNASAAIASGTTVDGGLYTSILLPLGTYIVEEDVTTLPDAVEAPLIAEYRIITVESDKTEDTYTQLVSGSGFFNPAKYGKFILQKTDSKTGASVAATFRLEYYDTNLSAWTIVKDGTEDYIFTTDASIVYESIYLTPGKYRLVETAVTGNYTLNTTPLEFDIDAGELTGMDGGVLDFVADKTNPIIFENDPQGSLEIEKLGTFQGTDIGGLTGITFKLYKRTGDGNLAADTAAGQTVIKTITTGAAGKVTTTGIDAGDYWLVETGVGTNSLYADNIGTAWPVTINIGEMTSLTRTAPAAGGGTEDKALRNPIIAGKFKIQKTVNIAGLTSATFKLERKIDNNGTITYENAGTFTVNSGATYLSGFLAPGWYRITEQSTNPAGYQLAEPFEIEILEDMITGANGFQAADPNPYVVLNIKQGNLVLDKIGVFGSGADEIKLEDLENVVFKLYKRTTAVAADDCVAANEVGSLTTDASGHAVLNNINPGDYWLKEISIGAGNTYTYTVDSTPRAITIVTDETFSLSGNDVIKNTTTYGKLKITKVDYNDNNITLSGAQFTIHRLADCSDNSLGTLTTLADGTATSGLLESGEYYLKEIKAPDNYSAVQNIYGPFTVASNTVSDAGSIENKRSFSIQVLKEDSENQTPLANAVFALYDTSAHAAAGGDTGRIGETKTTDSTGIVTFTGLTLDNKSTNQTTYYLREMTPPANYAANATVYPITISYSDNKLVYSQTVTNDLMGKIKLKKQAVWDGGTVDLGGVTFTFYAVTFEGQTHAPLASPAYIGSTDDIGATKGELITGYLPAGWYEVVETLPSGFGMGDSRATGNSFWVEVKNKEVNTVLYNTPIENVPVSGNFRIEKRAGDGTTVLSGVEFWFYKQKVAGAGDGADNYELADPANPDSSQNYFIITTQGGASIYQSGMLTPGRYMLVEKAAPTLTVGGITINFALDKTPIFIDIKVGETLDLTGEVNSIKNYPLMDISLTKKGDAKNGSPLLEGVEFCLYSDAVCTEPALDTQTTDSNGRLTFTGIAPGTYYVKESQTIDGYAVTPDARQVVVPKVDRLTDLVVEMGDWVNEADAGRVLILKNKEDGAPLAGAEFNIYGKNAGDGDGEYTKLMNTSVLTTDSEGKVLSDLLPADASGTDYKIVEVKAPEDYTLDDTFYPTEQIIKVFPLHQPTYVVGSANDNVAVFTNKNVADIGQFSTDIHKFIKDADETSYTNQVPVNADKSLLEEAYTVNFKISNLADGSNELPAKTFTLTDDQIILYSKNVSTGAYAPLQPNDKDYTIDSVSIYPAGNKDTSEKVTATLQYKTSLGDSNWTVKQANIDLSQAVPVTLDLTGDHVVAIQVVYSNVQAGFKALEGIEMTVTFQKREGVDMVGDTIPEIRRITNEATLEWCYDYKSKDGTSTEVTATDTSEVVEALIPTMIIPQVLISNQITNMPGTNVFYTGSNVDYQITVVNVEKTDGESADFKQPVIAFDFPAYTTPNSSKPMTVSMRSIVNGVPQSMELIEGQDFDLIEETVDGIIGMDENGNFITSSASQTTRYVLVFRDHIVLEPDDVSGSNYNITISYSATISYAKPSSQTFLYSPAYLSSTYKLPATLENPLGTSFEGYLQNAQENADLASTINDELEYLDDPTEVAVLNSEQIQLLKTVSATNGNFGSSQVNVYPNEDVYYNLTLYNNSLSNIKTARFVDILPFNGDSYVFRSGGGTTPRYTSIPNGSDYEEMILKNVTPQDGNAKIYYFVEPDTLWNSWAYASRTATTPEDELPMLYDIDGTWSAPGSYSGYWTDVCPGDMSLVTAVGIEVTFPDGQWMEPGDTYSVTLQMTTPGYTADKIEEYADKVMANSASAAVIRVGADEIDKTVDIVEPPKVLVGLKLPTGSVGDYVFYDVNNDGLQDSTDIPAAGIKVELYQTTLTKVGDTVVRSEQQLIKTIYTDGDGSYLFDELPCNYLTPGAAEDSTNPDDYVGKTIYYYQIKFDIPDNHAATICYAGNATPQAETKEIDSNIDKNGWSEEFVLKILNEVVDGREVITGEHNPTIDAGYVVSVGLGDKVWLDLNHDGLQSDGEPGVKSALVKLYRLASETDTISEDAIPYMTTLTDDNGEYLFTGLPQGYYVVEFDIRALTKDGYTYQYAFTYPDVTNSKLTTPDDSDACIPVDADRRVMRTEVIPLFFDLNDEIDYNGEKIDRTWDAGLYVYSAIGGYAFEDKNFTNLQDIQTDKMDGPIPGTIVKLYKVVDGIREDQPIRETVVGEDGRYFFDELDAGQYQVYFEFPEGYTAVESPDGSKNPSTNLSDTDDSDLCIFTDGNYLSGFTQVITLGYDTIDRTWDAGANKLSSLGDYVWFDTNRDGLQDLDEAPLEGIKVTLQYRMSDQDEWELYPGGTTYTDKDGKYLFEGLKGGDEYSIQYRVIFDLLNPNLVVTFTNIGDNREIDSDALSYYLQDLGYATTTIRLGYGVNDLTWDAGVFDTVCGVGDFVWYDKNRDGIQDPDEVGVANIPVVLECNDGDLANEADWVVVGTTVTDANGYYHFLDLQPGYYRVRFQVKDPYTVTLYNRGEGDNAYIYDSDASREGSDSWYYSRVFYLDKDQYDMTWDAGIYLKSDVPPTIIPIYNTTPTQYTYYTNYVRTGDNTPIIIMVVALIISAGVIGIIAVRRKRKKS